MGQRIWAQNVRGGPNWVQGVVVERSGPVSYVVQVNFKGSLMLWRRHTDQLKTCTESGDTISWPARSAPLPDRSDQISPPECPDHGMAIDARPQLSEGTTAPVDQQNPSVSPKPAMAGRRKLHLQLKNSPILEATA